jgi:16S rRNA (guanine527-N7)-methyltransferase
MAVRNLYDALTPVQREQLEGYRALLLQFNRRINLISRETEADFGVRHLLHVLTLTVSVFPAGSRVVDWGTGGGLPAIPLAICFPDVTLYAVDSVRKKVQAVKVMGQRLGLENLVPWHGRAEDWPGTAHYSVSRATAPLRDLWTWHARVSASDVPDVPSNAAPRWEPGLICLKGGDLRDEVAALQAAYPGIRVHQRPLQSLLGRDDFAGKYLLEVR